MKHDGGRELRYAKLYNVAELGLQRARSRGELDRIEKESLAFFERTRRRYLELAAGDETILTIDASQNIEQVQHDIRQTLTGWLACA